MKSRIKTSYHYLIEYPLQRLASASITIITVLQNVVITFCWHVNVPSKQNELKQHFDFGLLANLQDLEFALEKEVELVRL